MEESTADDKPNWSELPEDMLLTAMSAMDALDVVRSSAVCSHWRSTYTTLRRLRLPSSKQQSPCLLYPRPRPRDASGGPADSDDDARLCRDDDAPLYLYSPSADATVRIRLPQDDALVLAGSAHGWLFATDKAANPYLLNPLTGAKAPLPPVTTFQCVVGSSLDGHGDIVYHVDAPNLPSAPTYAVPARRARSWMYRHVAISAGGADPSCVVLVVHQRPMDLHFASPAGGADGRWAWASLAASLGYGFISAVYNDKDGLFYALQCCGTVHALDLHHRRHGPQTWVAARMHRLREVLLVSRILCLAVAPCGGVLLVARKHWLSEPDDVFDAANPFYVYKLDLGAKEEDKKKKPEKLEGIGDRQHVLLIGEKCSALCVKINMEDCPRLRTNCAYLADFIRREFLCDPFRIIRRRDMGVYWDFETGQLHNIAHLWPAHHLDLELPDSAPASIWITPSPF
ncbi:uncharacterized protein LOC112269397 [Brachypodium distachyon]|uniref:Uncharacterized protein n=1 Tax=Brachypodium distachyon TaxID=15368 RepID=A0A0Q3EB08_BRADI|nr:uncharacterized protein LOC112269397 [Brachypodium distachyon]KQJ84967.1 hypothetical protein BRADI_5g23964v3 [Brachypodium distachyon]|eukprot:XP_024311860.1 uncharacterized protein LOC112269397 [Brachypodium distachyon]